MAVGWFFRIIEGDDGDWTCRRGRQDLDRHDTMCEALDHITEIAAAIRPSTVFVHHADGRIIYGPFFES